MFSADIWAFIAFIAIVALVVWHDRKNVKPAGLVFMRRTKRGRAWLDRLVQRWPGYWRLHTLAGVVITIPAMVYVSYFLLSNAASLLAGHVVAAVRLVLPWSGFGEAPGLFFVPWYFWVIGIAVVVVPHELSHGLACRLSKIRVKSLGWMLFLFIPGAFVDPDEKQLKRAPRMAKLRVFAAGSFANIVVGVLCLLLWIGMLAALFTQAGIIPSAIIKDSPADAANLSGAIVSVGGIQITSQEQLAAVLGSIEPGSEIFIETTAGNRTIVTSARPDGAGESYIGISGPYQTYYKIKAPLKNYYEFIAFFVTLFQWLFVINLGIGLFNLLPIKPLDGGLIFEEIAGRFLKNNSARLVTIGVSLLMVAVVVFNIIGPALMS